MSKQRFLFVMSAVAAAIVCLQLGGVGAQPALSEGQEPDLDLGAEVYQVNCESCHGAAGKGDGPAARFLEAEPRDLTGGDWIYVDEITVESVAKLVAEGIDGTEMEPFEELLLPEEMTAVSAYVIQEFVEQ